MLSYREESDARIIINAADVKLRSFNTKVSNRMGFRDVLTITEVLQGPSECAAIPKGALSEHSMNGTLTCSCFPGMPGRAVPAFP